MLRMLRVAGIVVFAMLVGIAANNLWKMYENGNLAERYNSARKANVTMLVFAAVAVGALGYFEFSRIRKHANRRGYGRRHREAAAGSASVTDRPDSANIYSAPQTVDTWKVRRDRSPKSRSKQKVEMTNIWMGLLRICCVLMPVVYGGLMAKNLLAESESSELAWMLPSVYGAMALLSVVTTIGLMARKRWGMMLGYLLAICNLMVFPFGTALGLFFILGMVGASAQLVVPEHEKRRAARRKAQAMI